MRENVLTAADLIWPMFVVEGKKKRVPVTSMPGVERLSVDLAVKAAAEAAGLGIPAIAIFPYTDPSLRNDKGTEAFNPKIWCAAPCAPSRPACPRSASSATWRSIPTPPTAMTAC